MIVLLSQSMSGQYFHLATPADGSVVYFDTDYPRTGTTDTRQGRIYTVDASGMRLFAERQRELVPGRPALSDYFRLSGATVSGDGATKAFLGVRQCMPLLPCYLFDDSEITILRAGLPDLDAESGDVQLSANGRFAHLSPQPSETVRAVVLGLVPVDPAGRTGQAAPLEGPASVVRAGLSCWKWIDSLKFTIPVGAATMARGEIGICHLDLALPSDLPSASNNNQRHLYMGCDGIWAAMDLPGIWV